MAAAGVDERWCLGDLVGGEPATAELLGAARQLDLLIAGNHDAWALGPDRVVARGRDVFRLSSRAMASRHGIDCWHGSPRHPLLGFLTEASAARILPDRPLGSLGLVGHTHEPALFAYDGAATRAVRPVPGESYDWLATGACMANPGAVCGNPRDAASWWLIVDIDARVLRWHRKEFGSEEAAAPPYRRLRSVTAWFLPRSPARRNQFQSRCTTALQSESSLCQGVVSGARDRVEVAPRCRARWGRRVVSGPGVTSPKSRLLWGVRPVTLDARVVPALSSRARARRQCARRELERRGQSRVSLMSWR